MTNTELNYVRTKSRRVLSNYVYQNLSLEDPAETHPDKYKRSEHLKASTSLLKQEPPSVQLITLARTSFIQVISVNILRERRSPELGSLNKADWISFSAVGPLHRSWEQGRASLLSPPSPPNCPGYSCGQLLCLRIRSCCSVKVMGTVTPVTIPVGGINVYLLST